MGRQSAHGQHRPLRLPAAVLARGRALHQRLTLAARTRPSRIAPAELDYEALAVFARLGFYLNEDTPFRGISAMPPGARLEWRAGRLSVGGARHRVTVQAISRSSAIDAYIERFRAAVARRPPPDAGFVLPLSGGRDSRHILLQLLADGHAPTGCLTMRSVWPRDDQDARVAAQLAARVGLPVEVVAQPGMDPATELRKNQLTGYCADQHGWMVAMADALQTRTTCAYDGIAGDILSSGIFLRKGWLELIRAGRFEELARLLCAPGEARLRVIGSPQGHRLLPLDGAVARIATELCPARRGAEPGGLVPFLEPHAARDRSRAVLHTRFHPHGLRAIPGPRCL